MRRARYGDMNRKLISRAEKRPEAFLPQVGDGSGHYEDRKQLFVNFGYLLYRNGQFWQSGKIRIIRAETTE